MSVFPVNNAAHSQVPFPRSGPRGHTLADLVRAAGLGIQEITLETRQTEPMVGGSGAAGPAPDLRHQPPGSTHFCKQNVE